MDERVYTADVCPGCMTQRDSVGRSLGRCQNCGSEVHTVTVRFRVARAAILKQTDPHASLVERTLYYGCVGQAGHYYWGRGPFKLRGPRQQSGSHFYATVTPWGTGVEGLFGRSSSGPPEGEAHVFHRDGWTALAFQDRSVDSRPGSWSVYCIPAVLDGTEALDIAREAFPSIFERYGFTVRLAA